RGDSGRESLRWSAAFLYARGFDLEWSRVAPPGRFLRLPSYPWQRQRFWIDDRDAPIKIEALRPRDREDGRGGPAPAPRPLALTSGRPAAPVEGREVPDAIGGSWHRGSNGVSPHAGGTPALPGHAASPPAAAHGKRLVESLRQRVA